MITTDKVIEIFCIADDFCAEYENEIRNHQRPSFRICLFIVKSFALVAGIYKSQLFYYQDLLIRNTIGSAERCFLIIF